MFMCGGLMKSIKILSKDMEGKLIEVSVGDMVHDDLTGKVVKLVEILDKSGIIVDSTYLEGYRQVWEVSELFK